MTILKIKQAAIAAGVAIALTAVAACSMSNTDPTATMPKDAVARVGRELLKRAEVQQAIPANISAADSATFAEAYIKTWVSDKLITEVALEQIGNTEEIERLTEEYRRNLIMWKYREMAVRTDSALQITEANIRAYYDDHKSELKLSQPQLKGIYIKIESNAPSIAKVKKLYKSAKQDDIEELEKVGLTGAIHYDYFRDQWIPWEQIITKIPTEISPLKLHKGYTLEYESDGFTYLLSVSDLLPIGATMPYEVAAPQIRETLESTRLIILDEHIRERLFEQAKSQGKIEM